MRRYWRAAQQDDALYSWATVGETLAFAAEMKLPRSTSAEERRERVEEARAVCWRINRQSQSMQAATHNRMCAYISAAHLPPQAIKQMSLQLCRGTAVGNRMVRAPPGLAP